MRAGYYMPKSGAFSGDQQLASIAFAFWLHVDHQHPDSADVINVYVDALGLHCIVHARNLFSPRGESVVLRLTSGWFT